MCVHFLSKMALGEGGVGRVSSESRFVSFSKDPKKYLHVKKLITGSNVRNNA
jgi:hypothetical protein